MCNLLPIPHSADVFLFVCLFVCLYWGGVYPLSEIFDTVEKDFKPLFCEVEVDLLLMYSCTLYLLLKTELWPEHFGHLWQHDSESVSACSTWFQRKLLQITKDQ